MLIIIILVDLYGFFLSLFICSLIYENLVFFDVCKCVKTPQKEYNI
jgi:hypothetical protein